MRDIIEVERPVSARDHFGGEVTSWVRFWRGKAWVRFSSGSQVEVNGETFNAVTRKITVRYLPRFTPDMRICAGGLHYRILSIDHNRQDMSTTFVAELINE